VLPRGRAVRGIDPLQGGDELRQVGCRPTEIGDALGGRRLAFEPRVDRPRERIPLGGLPSRERDRDRKRQERSESRQPPLLLLQLQDVVLPAG